MNQNKYSDTEKIILDRIKKNINDNKEFSVNVAKVEINNILKNKNINIKNKNCKVVKAHLSYIPKCGDKCGVVFESNKDFEKKGFDKGSFVVFPSICKMDSYIFLKKQRILCHHCNCSFSLKSSLVNFSCFISNPTKLSIVVDLMKKRSEKQLFFS